MSAPARPRASRTASRTAPRRPGVPAGTLAAVVMVPLAASFVAVLVAVVAVTATAAGSLPGDPGALDAVAAVLPLWLAAHLVPVVLHGATVSADPLGPAILVGLVVAATARRARRRTGDVRAGSVVGVVAAIAAAHTACGVLVAALLTPGTVVDASPALAGVDCGVLAAVAATLGVAAPGGVLRRARRAPVWVRAGVRAGLLGAVLLLGAGAALVAASTLAHLTEVAAVFTRWAPAAGSGAGLLALTLGYLPNAVVAATSWLAGPGLSVGVAASSPTVTVAGPAATAPPLPLAALLPTAAPPSWAGLAFAVPLAVGTVVGWRIAPVADAATTRLRSVGLAAVTAAVPVAVLGALAGGRWGTGPLDPVSVPAGPLLLAVLGWVAVPGAVVVLLAGPAGPRRGPGDMSPVRRPD